MIFKEYHKWRIVKSFMAFGHLALNILDILLFKERSFDINFIYGHFLIQLVTAVEQKLSQVFKFPGKNLSQVVDFDSKYRNVHFLPWHGLVSIQYMFQYCNLLSSIYYNRNYILIKFLLLFDLLQAWTYNWIEPGELAVHFLRYPSSSNRS